MTSKRSCFLACSRPISFPELRSPWPAVGKRELWEHLFSNNNGNNRILHIRFYYACARSAQSACMISMAHAWNGCSQSSRFPTAGQGERSSGNEIGSRPFVLVFSPFNSRDKRDFLQLYCVYFGTTERLIIQLQIGLSLNPIPSNPCEISRILIKRIQLTARTSLPLGVIASIVKTGTTSRKESVFAATRLMKPWQKYQVKYYWLKRIINFMKRVIHCFDLVLVFSPMKSQPFVFNFILLLFIIWLRSRGRSPYSLYKSSSLFQNCMFAKRSVGDGHCLLESGVWHSSATGTC